MSVWRQKAIDIAPELKKEFQDPGLSPYTVFMELLPLLQQAHMDQDRDRIQKIYDYAEWCLQQKEEKLWNAAGVSFYEHLGDTELVFAQFTHWIKKPVYLETRNLLNERFDDERMKQLDKYYAVAKPS